MSDRLLMAATGDGDLFACVDPNTRTNAPAVALRKFVASLHPFRDEDEARAALVAAGGADVREWRR